MQDKIASAGARELSARYPVWLCDLWGVAHDGVRADRQACETLQRHRRAGGQVVFITNAPRPGGAIVAQIRGFGVPDDAWDDLVSSGDVTRELVRRRAGQRVHHIGPDEDAPLLEGLPVTFTGPDAAQALLCTGLERDGRDGGPAEQPQDYRDRLAPLARRGVVMICANPDRVVGVGGRLYPCAGALADVYEELGGVVEMAGKPYAPIYDVARQRAEACRERPVANAEILAIGDGLPTDMAGAAREGLAALFISGGIHEGEFSAREQGAWLERAAPGLDLKAVMKGLAW